MPGHTWRVLVSGVRRLLRTRPVVLVFRSMTEWGIGPAVAKWRGGVGRWRGGRSGLPVTGQDVPESQLPL
jgi:hypothetical protein